MDNALRRTDPRVHTPVGVRLACLVMFAYSLSWDLGLIPQGRAGYDRSWTGLDFDHVVWSVTRSISLSCIVGLTGWAVLGTGSHWQRIGWLGVMLTVLHLATAWKGEFYYSPLMTEAETDVALIMICLLTPLRTIFGWQFAPQLSQPRKGLSKGQYSLGLLLLVMTLIAVGMGMWIYIKPLITPFPKTSILVELLWIAAATFPFVPGVVVLTGRPGYWLIGLLVVYWICLPVGMISLLRFQIDPYVLGSEIESEFVMSCVIAAIGSALAAWVLRSAGLHLCRDPSLTKRHWPDRLELSTEGSDAR